MNFYTFMLGVLGVWRLTHLLHAEDGPWDLLVQLRSRASHRLLGGLLDCFYCLSLWIAVPFAFIMGGNWPQRGLLWFALSAGAILIERVTSREEPESQVQYFEERKSDVVLRTEAETLPPKNVGPGL